MKKHESVKSIMSTDLIYAKHGDKISDIKHLMDKNFIHHVPVVDGKKLIGILSVLDIIRESFMNFLTPNDKNAEEALDFYAKIEDIMTKDVITLKDTDDIAHAAKILSSSDYNSLPIINNNEELVGIITTKDLVGYLADQL